MEAVFIKLLNMSMTASWLILAVVILRFFLKRAPKWLMCALWTLVAVRLVCPISVESVSSLIPSAEVIRIASTYSEPPEIITGFSYVNEYVNPILQDEFAASIPGFEEIAPGLLVRETDSVKPMLQTWIFCISVVWLVGVCALILYAAVSYLHLKKRVQCAVHLKENLWQSEYVSTPFVLGLIHPRIYLPFENAEFQMWENQISHVIAHEKAHLKRGDHWWKTIGFLILAIHWFNPLCWIAYWLFGKDIELACDEKVIKLWDLEDKKMYSKTLILCSTNHRSIAACPLAFAETDIKNRVRNILNYKKPTFWMIVLSILICVGTAVCFLTNPKEEAGTVNLSKEFLEELQADTELKSWGANLPEGYTLKKALEDDQIIIADGDVINGQEQWMEFVERTSEGKKASVSVISYYTLGDKSLYDPDYYEEIKDDYPVMYLTEIRYDGQKYITNDGFGTEEFQYLKRFEGEPPKTAVFSHYVYYVLVNDNSATWEDIEWGMLSSQLGDGIKHKTVYSDIGDSTM